LRQARRSGAARTLLSRLSVVTSPQPAHDVAPASDAFVHREGARIVGALVVLLAAALLATGGLLWREHARAHPQTTPPAAGALR
jgi:hypothetical protein